MQCVSLHSQWWSMLMCVPCYMLRSTILPCLDLVFSLGGCVVAGLFYRFVEGFEGCLDCDSNGRLSQRHTLLVKRLSAISRSEWQARRQ
jgi:hypothetical protein